MKMNFKKTLSLILAVLMVMTVVPMSGMASEEVCTHENATIDKLSAVNGQPRHYVNNCPDCGLDKAENCFGPDATTCGEAKKCAICDQIIGAALDHTFAPGVENEETLKTTGTDCQVANTYYETCTECGAVSENDEDVFPSTTNFGPHDWDEGTVTYENCEEAGTRTYKCEIEGCDAEREEAVEASGHDFDKVEEDRYLVEDSVATCKKGAEYYYSCVNCGAKGTETFFSETTGAHNFVEVANPEENALLKSEATCSNPAEYYKGCSVCHISAKHVENVEEPTFKYGTPHAKPTTKDEVRRPLTEDEIKVVIHADCLNNAMYSLHCKKCGEPTIGKLEDAKEGIHFYEVEGTALNPGHRDLTKLEVIGARIEPTCTTKGQDTIYRCKEKDCPAQEIGGEVLLAKGHTYDKTKTLTYKEAECGLAGHYGREYCKDCDTSFYTDAKGADAGSEKGLKEKSIKALSHVNDLGGDDLCDICGTVVKPSETCKCICHKGGFMYIVAIFIKLFWRLTGTKEYCECSSVEEIVKHY